MKKILYTVSAIVLGLLASRAQAETGTKIAPYQVVHPQVDFVSTFGLAKGSELKFGVVVNPQSGQKITVSPNNELSGSYEGANTGNATLLGVGTLGSTANTINVSTVSRGSVTITGNVATLNKAGTVRLQFPDEIPLSDGITCGTVKLNPALDGNDPNSTADDDVLSTAREVFYGGTLTLSTNETGKHCVGSGQVTLVFDESAVFNPDDHSNDPVDDFSLIPPAQEPEPEYVFNSATGFYELTDPETGEVSYYWYDKIDDTYVPVEEYRHKGQYLEYGEWKGIEDSVLQTMGNYIEASREYYTEPSDLHVGNKDYEEDITISLVDPDSEFYEYSKVEEFLPRTDNASLSLYAMLHSDSGDYQDDGLLLKYDDIDTNGYIRIPVFGDRGDTVSGEVGPSLLDKNLAQHITESQDYVLEIPFAGNIYLTQYGIQWVGPDISGSTLREGNSVLRLYDGSIEDGKLSLVDEGTYSYLYGLFHE